MPTLRWRELPPIPKAIVDQMEIAYERGIELYPANPVAWSDWVAGILDEATKAVLKSYEAEAEKRKSG